MELTINIDGGSRGNPGPAAAGVSVRSADGKAMFEAGYYLGEMTNNSAEYYGLIRALDAVAAWPDASLIIISDSELLVKQITGDYRVKSAQLAGLFEQAQRRLLRRDEWTIRHVRREHNSRADALANRAMDAVADVIVVDRRPGTPPTKSDNGDGAPTPPPPPADKPSVKAICTTPSAAPPCPAPCRKSQSHVFSSSAPAGLCLDALSSMLHTVMALRDASTGEEPDADTPPLTVRCFKPGCGAVFELSADATV